MKANLIQKTYNGLLVLFFLSIISIPLITSIVTDDEEWSEAEKRMLEISPSAPTNVAESLLFPQKFEKYYKDHFGFRELMIFRYHQEMAKRFNMAGTPLVLKGQDKWLFYTRNGMDEDFRGELRLTPQELVLWRTEQRQRYQWLQERGIHYLSFSPPNKQTVYPEFLPKEYLKIKDVTRAEQLHEFLAVDHPFYVNVHDSVKKAKSTHSVYYQTDTHWNQYGAYVCFKEVMSRVQQHFPDEKFIVDFPVRKNYRRFLGGDLARMLMIQKKVVEEIPVMKQWKKCGQKAVFDVPLTNISDKKHKMPLLRKCPKASLNAIVFSDSFITNMEPFFSENFGQILYLKKEYDQRNVEELMESFRPDIIIEERVERHYFD